MEIIGRQCSVSELAIAKIAGNNDIGPRVITSTVNFNQVHVMYTRKCNIPSDNFANVGSTVLELLERLHNLGIVHGNLNKEAVVINPDGEVRLVGYKMSFYYPDADVKTFNIDNGYDAVTVDDLPLYDIKQCKMLFGVEC